MWHFVYTCNERTQSHGQRVTTVADTFEGGWAHRALLCIIIIVSYYYNDDSVRRKKSSK